MAQHSYEETPAEYPISQPPKSTVVVRWLWHSIKRTVFKQMKFVLDKVIGLSINWPEYDENLIAEEMVTLVV